MIFLKYISLCHTEITQGLLYVIKEYFLHMKLFLLLAVQQKIFYSVLLVNALSFIKNSLSLFRHSIGDFNVPFCLQSGAKPLAYAMAVNELGSDLVHQYVGQEPSGQAFNSLVLDANNKPHNPMINAGALAVTSLLKNDLLLSDRFEYVSSKCTYFSTFLFFELFLVLYPGVMCYCQLLPVNTSYRQLLPVISYYQLLAVISYCTSYQLPCILCFSSMYKQKDLVDKKKSVFIIQHFSLKELQLIEIVQLAGL